MYQQLILVGNVGKNPEMRYSPQGQAVTNFSVATSNSYTNSAGDKVSETTWFRIVAWGKLAEICNQYLKKGSKVMIVGRLAPDKETGNPKVYTRQDGSSASSYDVTAQTVKFLSDRNGGDEEPAEMEERASDSPY